MTAANPTQDEFKKLTSYCSRKYTASTDIVWADDMGETVSLEILFSRPDISLGSIPGIFSTVLPTPVEMAALIMSIISKARYKKECDNVANIQNHIMPKSVNLSHMLVRTISSGLLIFFYPTTINAVILHALYWDNLPAASTVSQSKTA